MDPNACLRRLLSALNSQDDTESVAAAADLLDWLLAGGFAPQCTPGQREQIALGFAQIADAIDDLGGGLRDPDLAR